VVCTVSPEVSADSDVVSPLAGRNLTEQPQSVRHRHQPPGHRVQDSTETCLRLSTGLFLRRAHTGRGGVSADLRDWSEAQDRETSRQAGRVAAGVAFFVILLPFFIAAGDALASMSSGTGSTTNALSLRRGLPRRFNPQTKPSTAKVSLRMQGVLSDPGEPFHFTTGR
jgi:hypothetical protein